mgnify:CR=1 FL=1
MIGRTLSGIFKLNRCLTRSFSNEKDHSYGYDIKGKWEETILTVIQKLNNFLKNGYPYGVILHEPYPEEL